MQGDAPAVTLVEGESDCHVLWHHGINALGLPGANNYKDDRDAPHLAGFKRIDVVIEPDTGGKAVLEWLERSSIRDRVWLVRLDGFKDPRALHLDDPERLPQLWAHALAAAQPFREIQQRYQDAESRAAAAKAGALLNEDCILKVVGDAMTRNGYAGDTGPALLVYLAATSRQFDQPLNVAIVAPSAAGKNRTTDAALDLMPAEAIYKVSATSPLALVYTDRSLKRVALVYEEADSIPDEGPAASAIRALAESNALVYEVVEKGKDGQLGTRRIEHPGPTVLITTSTRSLAPQLGTRLLEVPIRDDPEQTKKILYAHAQAASGTEPTATDVEPLIALQVYISLTGPHRVIVPFARTLAAAMPTFEIRMRRDFPKLLTCIKAHALLHLGTRERTADGAIIAALADYAAIRPLLEPVYGALSAGGLTPALRATVEAVKEGEENVSMTTLAERLKIGKPATSERVRKCTAGGWLINEETRRGQPAKLRRGDPLPAEASILPEPDALASPEHPNADPNTLSGTGTPKTPDRSAVRRVFGATRPTLARNRTPDPYMCLNCRKLWPAACRCEVPAHA